MFIDKDSIKVKVAGMQNYMSLGDYLVQATYTYSKLWANDSGRNLAGTMTGSLLGIFPKIVLQFGSLNKTQLETLAPILDAPSQSVQYYDPNKKATVTMTTYTGDWENVNRNIISGDTPNAGFSCSFIAIRKRA